MAVELQKPRITYQLEVDAEPGIYVTCYIPAFGQSPDPHCMHGNRQAENENYTTLRHTIGIPKNMDLSLAEG